MEDREVVWIALVPLAALAGLVMLLFEMAGLWPQKDVRPDLVWCVGFYAMRRSAPASTLLAASCCGLAHDLLLGPKLGAASLAYLLAACIFLLFKDQVAGGGFFEHAVLLGLIAASACFIRTVLTLGENFLVPWSGNIIVVLLSGTATLIVYPVVYLLLSLPFLNPTREKRWL